MSTALWTIGFIVVVLLVRLMMRRVALSRLYSSNLFKFLQSDEWKSIQDCYDAGFRKKSTARILEFFYQQKRLEVRLPDHRFNCEACGVHIADRVIRDPNFKYDDLPKNLTLEELKKIIFETFEDTMFDTYNMGYFEFRTVNRGGQPRRQQQERFKLKRVLVNA